MRACMLHIYLTQACVLRCHCFLALTSRRALEACACMQDVNANEMLASAVAVAACSDWFVCVTTRQTWERLHQSVRNNRTVQRGAAAAACAMTHDHVPDLCLALLRCIPSTSNTVQKLGFVCILSLSSGSDRTRSKCDSICRQSAAVLLAPANGLQPLLKQHLRLNR